jgi:hypothetical protein
MHRLGCSNKDNTLVATIFSVAYLDLKLKGFPKKVEAYILNPDMFVSHDKGPSVGGQA